MKNWLTKTKLVMVLGVFLGLGVSLAIAHVAHADTTNTVLSTLITPSSPEDTTSIDQRLVVRKATYKTQLATVNAVDLAGKCTLAQTVLIGVRTKDEKAAATRLQAYNDLVERLSFLVDNLSSQGVDATELLAAQNQFVAGINTYLNDAESYKTAMDDAITIDCKKDPVGFRASVLDARKWRTQLQPDVSLIKNTVVPLRKALADERQLLITKSGVKTKTN